MSSTGSAVRSTNSGFAKVDRPVGLQFLPKFAADRLRDGAPPELGECKVVGSYDKATKKMKFEYSVTWTDKSAKERAAAMHKTSKGNKEKSKKQKKQKAPVSCTGSCSCVSVNSCETCDANCRCECLESDFSCCTTFPCCCKSSLVDCESRTSSKVTKKSVASSKSSVCSKKKPKKKTEAVPIRKCDGPCGKRRSVKNLWLMGGCEHAICALCLSNAPMAEGPGDTLHCCNNECFTMELVDRLVDEDKRRKYHKKILRKEDVSALLAEYQPVDPRRRIEAVQDALDALPSENSKSAHSPPSASSADSSTLSESTRSTWSSARPMTSSTSKPFSELVNLSVIVISRGQCRSITYRRLSREISDTKLFYNLLEWIVLTGDLPAPIDEAAVYLSQSSKYRPDELTLVDIEKSLVKELWQFNVANGTFFLAIDYTNEFHKRGKTQKN